jgi:hypothetical protein
MIGKKINEGRLKTELDILTNILVGYQNKQKTAQDVLNAIDTFKKEVWKMV